MFSHLDDRVRNAVWCGLLIAGISTLFLVIHQFADLSEYGVTNLMWVDVMLVLGLTVGVWRNSRVCATLLFLYYVGSKTWQMVDTGKMGGLIVAALFSYWLFQGMLGTFDAAGAPVSGGGAEDDTYRYGELSMGGAKVRTRTHKMTGITEGEHPARGWTRMGEKKEAQA